MSRRKRRPKQKKEPSLRCPYCGRRFRSSAPRPREPLAGQIRLIGGRTPTLTLESEVRS